jgi:hypothetical protein
MRASKNAIALLITIMFVMVITVAIGFGLKQVNSASKILKEEKFMYQSTLIVEDLFTILKKSPDIKKIADSNSSDDLYMFLSQVSFIPFTLKNMEVTLKISSARTKFDPSYIEENATIKTKLGEYLNRYGVNSQYVEILADCCGGIQGDNSYNSRIFDVYPYLFRDYIASSKHLKKINNFYTQEYNDNALSKVDFNNLFYFGSERNTTIDLNYATSAVWEMMLGVSKERAEALHLGGGAYSSVEDLGLSDDESRALEAFKVSYFVPTILVEVEILEGEENSKISFEYNIKTEEGSNFVYEI